MDYAEKADNELWIRTLNTTPVEEDCYSIVIDNLKGLIHTGTIGTMMYCYEEDGSIQRAEKTFFSTIGHHPEQGIHLPNSRMSQTTDYFEDDSRRKNKIAATPIYLFSPEYSILNSMSDYAVDLNRKLCTMMNKFPCCFIWHDGSPDPFCKHEGLHIHLIVYNTMVNFRDSRAFRDVRDACSKNEVMLKTEKVKSIPNIMKYLQKPPRLLLGCNNKKMCSWLQENSNEATLPDIVSNGEGRDWIHQILIDYGAAMTELKRISPDEYQKYIKRNVTRRGKKRKNEQSVDDNASAIEGLQFKKTLKQHKGDDYVSLVKEFINRYKLYSVDLITRKFANVTGEELDARTEWRTLRLVPNFKVIWDVAITEVKECERQENLTYCQKFIKRTKEDRDQRKEKNFLDIQDTLTLFARWCDEQQLLPQSVLVDMYLVLHQRNIKKNTLLLQGASNAGKTYWANAICPYLDMVGQTIPSNDFTFMNCVDKDVIMIPELTLSKMEQVEEMKKIMEGIPTTVNIKNKTPSTLMRTPMILQCNKLPWAQSFGAEKDAFLNRCYQFSGLQFSETLLNHCKGLANPVFFSFIFDQLMEVDEKIHVMDKSIEDDQRHHLTVLCGRILKQFDVGRLYTEYEVQFYDDMETEDTDSEEEYPDPKYGAAMIQDIVKNNDLYHTDEEFEEEMQRQEEEYERKKKAREDKEIKIASIQPAITSAMKKTPAGMTFSCSNPTVLPVKNPFKTKTIHQPKDKDPNEMIDGQPRWMRPITNEQMEEANRFIRMDIFDLDNEVETVLYYSITEDLYDSLSSAEQNKYKKTYFKKYFQYEQMQKFNYDFERRHVERVMEEFKKKQPFNLDEDDNVVFNKN